MYTRKTLFVQSEMRRTVFLNDDNISVSESQLAMKKKFRTHPLSRTRFFYAYPKSRTRNFWGIPYLIDFLIYLPPPTFFKKTPVFIFLHY